MRYEESEELEVFLKRIINDSQHAVIDTAKDMAKITKAKAEKRLKDIQRAEKLPKSRTVHMYQDVDIFNKPSKDRVEVGGKKKTGTLWHIVNDGTYRSRPTHFIEWTLKDVDKEVDKVFEKNAKRSGFND